MLAVDASIPGLEMRGGQTVFLEKNALRKRVAIPDVCQETVSICLLYTSGASSASYLNKFQALGADIEKINKMLQEQVNDLTAMAEEYERAEQEAQTAASALKNNIVG